MNSPMMPGQNSSGEKAAIRVAVATTTGPNMRRAASAKAGPEAMPSVIRRSAYSVTMIASSTSMPTARIRLNSTTILTVKPATDRARMPIRNEVGMARPIRIDERMPRKYRITMNTRITAVSTEFCKSSSIVRMSFDLSWLKLTSTPAGSTDLNSSATAFTPSTVSMRFAPDRLDTSIAIAGLPLSRAMESASSKVERIVARSRARTTAFPLAAIGRFAMSSTVSISAGTLTAYLPSSPSSVPAATSWLLALTPPISWSSCKL